MLQLERIFSIKTVSIQNKIFIQSILCASSTSLSQYCLDLNSLPTGYYFRTTKFIGNKVATYDHQRQFLVLYEYSENSYKIKTLNLFVVFDGFIPHQKYFVIMDFMDNYNEAILRIQVYKVFAIQKFNIAIIIDFLICN